MSSARQIDMIEATVIPPSRVRASVPKSLGQQHFIKRDLFSNPRLRLFGKA
jgi:hypothetical protein